MKEGEIIQGLMLSLSKKQYSINDLLYLIQPFNISPSSLRTNLWRLIKKNFLKTIRQGKKAYYSLSAKAKIISKNVALSFKSPDWHGWDNSWWGIVFSVPENKKPVRHRIRKKLLAYRFAPLYAGFWIRPFHAEEKLDNYLQNIFDHGYGKMIHFHSLNTITKEEISRIWKLKQVNQLLYQGIALLKENHKELKKFMAKEALAKKIFIGNEIVPILFKDPLLPAQFLPEDWQAENLRKFFFKWYNEITKIAQPYWQKIFIQ